MAHPTRLLDGPPTDDDAVVLALAGECATWPHPDGGMNHRVGAVCPFGALLRPTVEDDPTEQSDDPEVSRG